MPKHPTTPEGWDGSLEDLAVAVEGMRYDALAEFLDMLSGILWTRAQRDFNADRPQLATHLNKAASQIAETQYAIEEAWDICKPYMGKKIS